MSHHHDAPPHPHPDHGHAHGHAHEHAHEHAPASSHGPAHPVQSEPAPLTPPRPTHAEIARRAYERYLARGRRDGQDLADWFAAERELLADPTHRS